MRILHKCHERGGWLPLCWCRGRWLTPRHLGVTLSVTYLAPCASLDLQIPDKSDDLNNPGVQVMGTADTHHPPRLWLCQCDRDLLKQSIAPSKWSMGLSGPSLSPGSLPRSATSALSESMQLLKYIICTRVGVEAPLRVYSVQNREERAGKPLSIHSQAKQE